MKLILFMLLAIPLFSIAQNPIADGSSTDPGYKNITAKLVVGTNERVDVKVNGQNILSFGYGTHEADISPFLMPGKLNKVVFSFKGQSFIRSWAEVTGKFPDDEKGISLYTFKPGEKGTEGIFECTYAGAKSRIGEGYKSVTARLVVRGTVRVTVKINGRNILSLGYGTHETDISHFLTSSKLNTVTFSFDKEGDADSDIYLTGNFPDDKKGITFYSFQPGKNGLEGTSEFPFAGVKNPSGKPTIKAGYDLKKNKKV